jgi:hypothetical protein
MNITAFMPDWMKLSQASARFSVLTPPTVFQGQVVRFTHHPLQTFRYVTQPIVTPDLGPAKPKAFGCATLKG